MNSNITLKDSLESPTASANEDSAVLNSPKSSHPAYNNLVPDDRIGSEIQNAPLDEAKRASL